MRNKTLTSKERLIHISTSVEKINTYTQELSFDQFVADQMAHEACMYQFMIIGEAIIHVDDSYLNKYDYPWYKVRAFRNILAHEYFGISLEAIWDVIQMDLPKLKIVVDSMLKNEF